MKVKSFDVFVFLIAYHIFHVVRYPKLETPTYIDETNKVHSYVWKDDIYSYEQGNKKYTKSLMPMPLTGWATT